MTKPKRYRTQSVPPSLGSGGRNWRIVDTKTQKVIAWSFKRSWARLVVEALNR